jgi:hypothetical protein
MHNRTSTFIAIEKNAEVLVLFSITFTKQKKEIVHKMPFLISGFRVATSFYILYLPDSRNAYQPLR